MPQLKPKPSEIAAEAKRTHIPYIEQRLPQFPSKSYLHSDSEEIRLNLPKETAGKKLRVAVIDGDPIDVALDWYEYDHKNNTEGTPLDPSQENRPIPVVNMANEKRAGGDWESGLMAPEENLCRRSNLVHCLNTPWSPFPGVSNYPIPTKGGIYSPCVVVFRSGADGDYAMWQNFRCLPVISVAPVRRPKLNESGTDYSFYQEKELMKDKIRTVLRIAASWHHRDICIGAFGAGPGCRNPVQQLAIMWRDVLFSEPEFQGAFTNIVFAIESALGSTNPSQVTDYEIFRQEFDAAKVFKAYR